jgi:hypothetical protein
MDRTVVFERVVPYMMRWGIPLSKAMAPFTGEEWPIATHSVSDDADAMFRLLSDPEFEVLLQARYGYLGHATNEYQAASEEIDRILEDIDNSLPDKSK